MKQLYVFCEGPTEQGFCSSVLEPHLFAPGAGRLHTLAVGRKNDHHVFGVNRRNGYGRIRTFIVNIINQRAGDDVFFTTLLDLYGLPDDFPGKVSNRRSAANPTPYVVALEEAFGADIDHHRFVPHLQLHEFETLLFSEPEAFRIAFDDCDDAIKELQEIVASVPSVEHINDGRETAPSKRIIKALPRYDGRKTSAGPDIAVMIGIAGMRAKCPHFGQWLHQLEAMLK